jgi:hypothetical protein
MSALRLVALLLAALTACGGDDGDGDGASGTGGGSQVLTDGEADACEQDCDAQAATNCERMPPDWAATCKLFCESLRSSTPEQCQAALRAQSQCALERVTYSCQDGLNAVMPQGACAGEYAQCAQCRGSLCVVGLGQ